MVMLQIASAVAADKIRNGSLLIQQCIEVFQKLLGLLFAVAEHGDAASHTQIDTADHQQTFAHFAGEEETCCAAVSHGEGGEIFPRFRFHRIEAAGGGHAFVDQIADIIGGGQP